MPLRKQDAERALSIFEGLIAQVESSLDNDENQDELHTTLTALQSTVDVLSSPLFSSLLEIRQQYEQTIATSQNPFENSIDTSKETELKLDSDPTLLSQFQQRYGIACGGEVHSNELAVSTLAADSEALEESSNFLNDSISPSPHSLGGQFRFPSTFVGDRAFEEGSLSVSSEPKPTQLLKMSAMKSGSKFKKYSGKKLFSRTTSTSSTGSISLADLASSLPARDNRELQDRESATMFSNVTASSESSLSSLPSEPTGPSLLETIQKQTFTTTYPKSPQEEGSNHTLVNEGTREDNMHTQEGNIEVGEHLAKRRVKSGSVENEVQTTEKETDGPKDILFFMRDKKSQTELQELTKVRESRIVTLELRKCGKWGDLGMDLAGVTSTGVFVSHLYPGGLAHSSGSIQPGDQILKFNQHDTGNMASFEVDMLIRQLPPSEPITFLLKYNPIGWLEYQKLCPPQ